MFFALMWLMTAAGIFGIASLFDAPNTDDTDETENGDDIVVGDDTSADGDPVDMMPETDTEEPVLDESPDPDPTLDPEPLDTGASLIENEDGSLSVELGDDETGHLVALKLERTGDGHDFDRVFELGLFVMPEDSAFVADTEGGRFVDLGSDTLDDYFDELGLTEIARFDLGRVIDMSDEGGAPIDTRVEPPLITSDDPIEIVRLRYAIGDSGETTLNFEGDETLSPFEAPGIFNGAVEASLTGQSETGTQGVDFIIAQTASDESGIVLGGLGADDTLMTNFAQSTVDGGAGDDLLYGVGNDNLALGGDGNDTIYVGANGMGLGGDGDDTLTSVAGASMVGWNEVRFDLSGDPVSTQTELFGEAGDDHLSLYDPSAVGHGGAGDDRISLRDGASGFGGAGDDRFNIAPGTTADGGAGDDSFSMSARVLEGGTPAVVTGGAGADSYEFNLTHANGASGAEFLHITDFDPAEDMLRILNIEYNPTLIDVSLQEAADGSYSDIIARYSALDSSVVSAVIRLEGVSGVTVDQILA